MATEANDTVANAFSQLKMTEFPIATLADEDLAAKLKMTDCPIATLADEDLSAIFRQLPPFERLIVSEVSTMWRDISQTPWHDVTHMDLSQVPTAHIHAVIKKCPKLTSVSALRQNLGDLGRFASRINSVPALKCVDCTLTTIDYNANVSNASVRSSLWEEVIWQNSKIVVADSNGAAARECPLLCGNPHTLRRLQICASELPGSVRVSQFSDALGHLPLLESCILAYVNHSINDRINGYLFSGLACLYLSPSASLRELYLDPSEPLNFMKLVFALPGLKILYLNNVVFERGGELARLVTQHSSLRVLVMTASYVSKFDGEILIPVRKLFPNGYNAPSVPQLHLFLGKIAAGKLRFHPSPSPTDALKIYPIDAPLPQFLEKEEIKLIFEGSWIASRIKEGAKEGANLADYSFEGNAGSISYVQE